MLFLHFRIGDSDLALAAERIVEIVPLVELRAVRRPPVGVAGSLEYRGRFIPIIDLCVIELGRPAGRRLSTRIVIVRHPAQQTALFGLIAEQATEMLNLDPGAFTPFARGPRRPVQRVELEDLLPQPLLSCLADEPAPQ